MKFRKMMLALVKGTGVALVIFGIAICILGIAMSAFEASPEDSRNGPQIALVSMAFTFPGLFLMYLARRSRKRMEILLAIAGIVNSHRRITLTDLAAKLMIPTDNMGNLLALAISQGLVKGNFDRTTYEFFTEDGKHEQHEIRFCSSCGSPFERIYLKGETIKCRSCGNVIS